MMYPIDEFYQQVSLVLEEGRHLGTFFQAQTHSHAQQLIGILNLGAETADTWACSEPNRLCKP